jgi:predicted dehydrogenase
MAMSLREADSMIATAAETGKKLFVHQNYRFFPEFTHIKEVIDSGHPRAASITSATT